VFPSAKTPSQFSGASQGGGLSTKAVASASSNAQGVQAPTTQEPRQSNTGDRILLNGLRWNDKEIHIPERWLNDETARLQKSSEPWKAALLCAARDRFCTVEESDVKRSPKKSSLLVYSHFEHENKTYRAGCQVTQNGSVNQIIVCPKDEARAIINIQRPVPRGSAAFLARESLKQNPLKRSSDTTTDLAYRAKHRKKTPQSADAGSSSIDPSALVNFDLSAFDSAASDLASTDPLGLMNFDLSAFEGVASGSASTDPFALMDLDLSTLQNDFPDLTSVEPPPTMPPSFAAFLNNGSEKVRQLSKDPFRSSVAMPWGETLRLSSAKWLTTSPLEQAHPGLADKLLDELRTSSFSLEKQDDLTASAEDGRIYYRSPKHDAVLELCPDKTGKFALASVSLSGMTCNNPSLTRPRLDDPIHEHNLAAAEETLIHIRTNVYKPNFKSSNKKSAKRDEDYETKRIANAGFEVDWIRVTPQEQRGAVAYTARGHNCTDLVYAAHFFSSSKGISAKPVYMDGHAVLVIGDNPPDPLPADMKEWPAHLTICDPWANIACLATDYPSRFTEKMEKWESEGKTIQITGTDFISPNDPEWKRNVLEGKKDLIHIASAPENVNAEPVPAGL
jgi:hypothetical protein